MLFDDIQHGKSIWTGEEIYTMIGFEGDYPEFGSLEHFKWRQFIGRKRLDVDKIFETKRVSIRLTIAHSGNGSVERNAWRAVPKEEVLNWCALESAKKIIGPMLLAARRALGLSQSEDLPIEVSMTLSALSGGLIAQSRTVLKNCQTIDGLPKAKIKELQQWHNRKARKLKKLLEE